MTSRLIDALVTTEALTGVFDDASVLAAMLEVEAALARAEAALGLVPASAAAAITHAAAAGGFDIPALAGEARRAGTLAVPLVSALTARVRDGEPDAARFVHFGATSQDIVDTALVLLIGRACDAIALDQTAIAAALRALSERHATAVMLARTLLQPAPPITFGLKAAHWCAAVERSWRRVERARVAACLLQFGGASGTLAALGERGPEVADALARELRLPCPAAPWHTSRDRLAALAAACGIYAGGLGKIARDISLLMQDEIGEARERGGPSSTMPHKQNPAGCAVVLAAAAQLPGLVGTLMAGLVQEHERAVGSWQAEWPVLAAALQATGAAAAALREVVAGLQVDPARMRANLEATRGVVFAERVMLHAVPAIGREQARTLVEQALVRVRDRAERFGDAVRATPALAALLDEDVLQSIDDPHAYLGAAETLRRRLLVPED